MTDIEVLLIRHAHAGKRGGEQDDRRPLSGKGRRQAAAIATRHRDVPLARTVTSPFLRCVQTIEPLASLVGTRVERLAGLGEGAGPGPALTLVEAATTPIAICTHGDVLGDVLMLLERRGVELDGDGLAKGCTWHLTVADGTVIRAHYEGPPT
jgi:8-oxo-dGTP diphosphatase